MATARAVARFLKSKGFIEKRQRGAHLVLQHPTTKYRTVVPIHPGDLPKGLLHRILKDAGCTLGELNGCKPRGGLQDRKNSCRMERDAGVVQW